MSILLFDTFWAKSDGITTLPMHTRHVVTAGQNLLERLPFSESERVYWKDKLLRCAILHDLGKIHKSFQSRLMGKTGVSIRHEILSLWFCENFLELSDDELFAIATHHKGVASVNASGRLEKIMLTSHLREHVESESALFTKETLQSWLELMSLDLPVIDKGLQKEISTDKVKLLFGTHQIKILPNSLERQNLSLMRALLVAADHIGSARHEDSIPQYKRLTIEDFQPRRGYELLSFRGFQQKLQYVIGDLILHAPTGSGKTEAALSWVYANQTDNARLFYLLPYTASINAMVGRLQKIYGEDKVTALHSKTLDFFYNQLTEEDSNDEGKIIDYEKREELARAKRSLSAELFFPVKVATLHQILKTSLKGKGWELSLYDYKNALFIIDEFHTYNPLLSGLLLASVKLFRKLFNARFFFMSATIPDFMLDIIVKEIFESDYSILIRPNPSEKSDNEILDRKRHQLFCKTGQSIIDDIGLIQQLLDEGKSVLVIVNNVRTAQKLYKECNFNTSVKLLHSGFHRKDRTDIENCITHEDLSKRPQLLIATQAVEVSLDIDYDVAFIENAPIDALIQRLGRVNRAGKKGLAPIYLYENIIGRTPFYDEEVLKDTWDVLLGLDGLSLSEQDLIMICNKVYKGGYNEIQQAEFLQGLNNSIIKNFEEDWIAADWNDWVEYVIENNNQKIEVLCSNLIDQFDELKKQRRFIEANQLLISIYLYELKGTLHEKDERRNVIVAYDIEYCSVVGYKKKDSNPEDFFL